MKQFLPFLMIVCLPCKLFSQAYFTSNSSGNWDSPASWTLVSGSSSSNYPVSGDSVIVLNGNSIFVNTNAQCQSLTVKATSSLLLNTSSTLTVTNNLLITETSAATISTGAVTITGNLTVNQGSVLLQNGGIISVIGLIFITAPGTPGTSLVNVDAGVFSCVGGLTITGTTATRIGQLIVGNSAVNVIGALTTVTANGKIIFSGTGALTLAGIVTTSNASFNAGNGKVIYVGIPGSNQTISPLTYNRLVITGAGSGSKTINGNVIVTDTLTLLSDTLMLNGAGTLTLNNNATIVKTTGALLSVPTYAGQIDLLYNNVLKDTTGPEMPLATNVLRNLTVSDISGLTLNANTTLSNQLTLQNGELATNNFILSISNTAGGAGTDPAINRINGFVNGKINRTIGTTGGTRIFPFGIGINQGYREYKIDYSAAPTTAGILSVQHYNTDAAAQSGLPLADGPVTLINTAPYYWQADALNGLAGGVYNLTLTAEGTSGVNDFTTLRIVKRPSSGGSWALDGTAGINTGPNAAPVVTRAAMSNFSQFTIAGSTANILPLVLLGFTGSNKNEASFLNWKTNDEINTAYFIVEKSLNGSSFKQLGTVAASGNTNALSSYEYKDINTEKGVSYYRLKITDKDGKYFYSKTIVITINSQARLLVYPALAHGSITITNNNATLLLLYNANGAFIKNMVTGQNNISGLANGTYLVKTGESTARFIKY